MDRNRLPTSKNRLLYIHEGVFSINLAYTVVALTFLHGPSALTERLARMEMLINEFLNIRQTDFIAGYWEFYLPVAVLALCLWFPMYLSSNSRLTRKILRSLAGMSAICGIPIIWLSATYLTDRKYGWSPLRAIQVYELILIFFCLILYLWGKWRVPRWCGVFILLFHCGFWFYQFGLRPRFSTYSGPNAPIMGLIAVLTWALFVGYQSQQ